MAKSPKRRPGQVAEIVRQVLAEALARDIRDPRVGLITLTRVDVSGDLSHAKVFVMARGEGVAQGEEGVAKNKSYSLLATRYLVEAQGIEPWSEPAFSAASTCVGRCLRVVPGRSSANLPGTNLRRISPGASEDHARPARLCYSTPTPRTGSVAEGAFASLAQLRQPAPNQSWQLNVSKRFYQEPGPGHAAIPSTDPSKPVAPVFGLPGS